MTKKTDSIIPEWMADENGKINIGKPKPADKGNWNEVERQANRLPAKVNSVDLEGTDVKLISIASGGWGFQDKSGGIMQGEDAPLELIEKAKKALALNIEGDPADLGGGMFSPTPNEIKKEQERSGRKADVDSNKLIPD